MAIFYLIIICKCWIAGSIYGLQTMFAHSESIAGAHSALYPTIDAKERPIRNVVLFCDRHALRASDDENV